MYKLEFNRRWGFLSVLVTQTVVKENRVGNITKQYLAQETRSIAKLSKDNNGIYQFDMIEDESLRPSIISFLKQNNIKVEL
jgi:hypothetical protein